MEKFSTAALLRLTILLVVGTVGTVVGYKTGWEAGAERIAHEASGHCGGKPSYFVATRNLQPGTVLTEADAVRKELYGDSSWTVPKLTWNGLIPIAEYEYKYDCESCDDTIIRTPVGKKLKWSVGKGQFFSKFDFENAPVVDGGTK